MFSTSLLDPRGGDHKRRPDPISTESSYYDSHLDCTILTTTPTRRPELWKAFIDGALESYSHFGVDKALEYDRIADGSSTSRFFVALDDDGDTIGGFRVQGPYSLPHQTHADIEWADSRPGRTALRAMVSERLAHGVVEMKAVWSAVNRPRRGSPGYLGAIGASLAAVAAGSRFTLATGADHAVDNYLDSGAVVAAHIDAVPYPDNRYRTRVLWWDQHTVLSYATAERQQQIAHAVAALLDGPDISTEAEAS